MRTALALLLFGSTGLSCNSESRPATVTDQQPAEADSGPPPSPVCTFADGSCGPPEACCPRTLHVIGMRADLERGCHSATREILFCRTDRDGGACGADAAYDCWKRREPDGGVTIFFTPYTWRAEDLPGYEHCEPDLYDRVASRDRLCE